MITCVYIAADKIMAVTGGSGRRIKVKQCCQRAFIRDEQALLTDVAPLSEALSELWREYKLPKRNIWMLLDSLSLQLKTIYMPPLKERELLRVVEQEFTSLREPPEGGQLFDYMALGGSGAPGIPVLATAVGKPLIAAYIEAAARAGLSLSGVDLAVPAMARLARKQKELRGQNGIVAVAEGGSLLLMLFVDGTYSFCTRYHLTEQRLTPASAVEIARDLSSMIQFSMSHYGVKEIAGIYFSGLSAAELDYLPDMSTSLGVGVLPVPEMPLMFSPPKRIAAAGFCAEYLLALAGLVDK